MARESKWGEAKEVMILDFQMYEASGYPIGRIKCHSEGEVFEATCFWEGWFPLPKIGSTYALHFAEKGDYLNFSWPNPDHEDMNPNGTRKPSSSPLEPTDYAEDECYEYYGEWYPENDLGDIPF